MNRDMHRRFVENLTATFHENTFYTTLTLEHPLPKGNFPRPPRDEHLDTAPFVPLPPLPAEGRLQMSLQEAILRRRSVRTYQARPMSPVLLGRFLAALAQVKGFPDDDMLPPIASYLHFYLLLWGGGRT